MNLSHIWFFPQTELSKISQSFQEKTELYDFNKDIQGSHANKCDDCLCNFLNGFLNGNFPYIKK